MHLFSNSDGDGIERVRSDGGEGYQGAGGVC